MRKHHNSAHRELFLSALAGSVADPFTWPAVLSYMTLHTCKKKTGMELV